MRRNSYTLISILFLLPALAPITRAQVGDVSRLHDPCVIEYGGKFYVFHTGAGVPMRVSDDLYTWKNLGKVFEAAPAWTGERVPKARTLWAPDIACFNGRYHLYYSVSSFGSRSSSIGLVTNVTLDPTDPKYQWIDRGEVIRTTDGKDDWNAIDAAVCLDESGTPWMAIGSFWSGLKLVKLDPDTGLRADPAAPVIPIAMRPRSKQGAIEAPFLQRRGEFYYLWASADFCCRGVDSTYNVVVGRSKKIDGPYVDRDGKPMLEGGGTSVLSGYANVKGPGHNAVLSTKAGDFLVHHFYDADNRGRATLQIRPIHWDEDGWPLAHEPIRRPGGVARTEPHAVEGQWSVWFTDSERKLDFRSDGTFGTDGSRWKRHDGSITLQSGKAETRCYLADDGESFVGRSVDGSIVRARRTGPTTGPS